MWVPSAPYPIPTLTPTLLPTNGGECTYPLKCVTKLQWTRQILLWPLQKLGRFHNPTLPPQTTFEVSHRPRWPPSPPPRKIFFILVTSLLSFKRFGIRLHQFIDYRPKYKSRQNWKICQIYKYCEWQFISGPHTVIAVLHKNKARGYKIYGCGHKDNIHSKLHNRSCTSDIPLFRQE